MLVENYFHGCYCDSMLVFFFFFGVLSCFSCVFPSLLVARDLVTTYHDSTACAHVP